MMNSRLFGSLSLWERLFLLGLALFLVFWTHPFPQSTNDGSRFAFIESSLRRNVNFTDGSPYFNGTDTVYYRNHYYCDKQPLLQFCSLITLRPLYDRFGFKPGLFYRWITLGSAGAALSVLFFLLIRLSRSSGFSVSQTQLVLGSVFFWLYSAAFRPDLFGPSGACRRHIRDLFVAEGRSGA